MAPAMGVSITLLAFAGFASVAEAQPSTPAGSVTGIVCNEGFSGNRGAWIEIDSHSLFATSITVGGLDASFVKKFFPDHRAKQPATSVSFSVTKGTCMPDESSKSLVACTAATAVAPQATLTYYTDPDEITVRRSIAVMNVKVDMAKNDAGAVTLALAFDATVRGKKVKYTFAKTFGALQARLGPSALGGPQQACAVTAGLSVTKLR